MIIKIFILIDIKLYIVFNLNIEPKSIYKSKSNAFEERVLNVLSLKSIDIYWGDAGINWGTMRTTPIVVIFDALNIEIL
jgi:hypothetical protein